MKKYFFSFSGCVEVEAESLEDAENVFTGLSQHELADCFREFEVTDEHGNDVSQTHAKEKSLRLYEHNL